MDGEVMSVFNFRHWMQLSPKDWVLRIISLGMAIVLWNLVGGEDIVNKNVMVRVEVINLPRDLVISNQFKRELEVTVSGPRSLVLNMGSRFVSRQVDLERATPGTMVLENSIDVINVPRGVKVLRVQPESVILSLDKMIQKQFVVSPVTAGTLAPDYILKGILMKPDSISITGPQTVLSQFDVLHTRPIAIEGLHEATKRQIPLDLDPLIIDLIGPTTVTADLDIAVEIVHKKIPAIPVKVLVNGKQQRVTPATVSITVELPKTLIRDRVDLHSLFNVSAIDAGKDGKMQVKVTPNMEFDPPIKILNVEPLVVTLIEKVDSEEPEKE